jgi:hypothetical protein
MSESMNLLRLAEELRTRATSDVRWIKRKGLSLKTKARWLQLAVQGTILGCQQARNCSTKASSADGSASHHAHQATLDPTDRFSHRTLCCTAAKRTAELANAAGIFAEAASLYFEMAVSLGGSDSAKLHADYAAAYARGARSSSERADQQALPFRAVCSS